MNVALLSLIGLSGLGIYYGIKKRDTNVQLGSCFFEHLAIPISTLLDEYVSNTGLILDRIDENAVHINTPLKRLFGLELVGFDNTLNFLPENLINQLFRNYKKLNSSYLFYAILKQGKYQKQYLFSHNENLLKNIGSYYNIPLMKGQELLNAIYDLYLQNTFTEENKQIKRNITIDLNDEKNPDYVTFKKIAKQAVYKNLVDLDIFQSYKAIEGISKTDIQRIYKLDFEGVIWTYFDFYEKRIENAISNLINTAKWSGNKQPFVDLKNQYNTGSEDLMIINSVLLLKKYNKDDIGSIGTALKNSFLPKDIFRKDIIRKTPLKYRDFDFDYLVDKQYFKDYITTLHKKPHKYPDIYGLDKNRAFINYSFSGENNNPHMFIIAETGSGKSVAKQKIIAQMIDLNFKTGYAENLGNVKVRSYDVGFSDEVFVNLIKSNYKNKVAHLGSDFSSFSYNLVNLDTSLSKTEYEADKQFATDLMSVILESQGSESLNIGEARLFKEAIEQVYKKNQYQLYRLSILKDSNTEIYNKLKALGYKETSYLKDIQEPEFYFLKKPLLGDITKYCTQQSSNEQIKIEDKNTYATLAKKCRDVEKLNLFSRFDSVNVIDADFISMDLNNFKESSLFAPIFLCIFQKIYFKDRNNALNCKRTRVKAPKLIYAIEEIANFFAVPYCAVTLGKIAFEARKYNVHFCLIAQESKQIPEVILRQVATRIFLLIPTKKGETINEIKNVFNAPQKVIEALDNTEMHELCIWYSKGVFNLKFEISQEEMDVFNTNPNNPTT